MAKDPNAIGALWIKNEGTAKEFLSGVIDGRGVVVFKNKYKKGGERTPDYRILLSNRSSGQQANTDDARPAPAAPEERPEITDDDIPF